MGGLTRTLVFGCSGALLLVACGGSDPEPNSQFQAGGQVGPGQPQQPGQPYPQQQQPQPQQPFPQQQQPQPAPATSSPIPGLPAIPGLPGLPPNAPAGSPAQQLDASAGAAAQPLINQLATTQAPGAKPLGAAMVGMFQPGQQLESPLQLQPGKCYTVIAVGLPAVSEVNVQLVATVPLPGMSPVLAQDQTTGPQATLAPAPNCYKWPFPLAGAAKVITTVGAGQGLAAVQVYEK
jgi:hypothetical protein